MPVVAVIAVFYMSFPELWLGITRLPATMYIGTGVLFIVLWLFMRFAEFVRKLAGETGGDSHMRSFSSR